MPSASVEKLVSDFRIVMNDVDELLKATAHDTNDKLGAMRGRIDVGLASARQQAERAESAVREGVRASARAGDRFVHERPWAAVGIGAGVGLIVGLLIARR